MGAAVGLVLEIAGLGALLRARTCAAGSGCGRRWSWSRSRAVPRLRRHWRRARLRPGAAGLVVVGRPRVVVLLHRVPGDRLPQPQPDPAHRRRTPGSTSTWPTSCRWPARRRTTSRSDLPQVAGEPLDYHWFGYVHMAMTEPGRPHRPAGGGAAAGHPGAVRGWRSCSPPWSAGGSAAGPYVGAVAAALFFAVGEFSFTDPVALPVRYPGHVRDLARHVDDLQLGAADRADRAAGRDRAPVRRSVHCGVAPVALRPGRPAAVRLERGEGELAAGGGGRARRDRAGAAGDPPADPVGVWSASAWWPARPSSSRSRCCTGSRRTAARSDRCRGSTPFWSDGRTAAGRAVRCGGRGLGRVRAQHAAALRRHRCRCWLSRRGSADPASWFLVAGGVAGPAIYLLVSQTSGGNQYFTRSGFAFGVIASAWGYGLLFERAAAVGRRQGRAGRRRRAFVLAVVWANLTFAHGADRYRRPTPRCVPILSWAWLLAVLGAGGRAGLVVRRVPAGRRCAVGARWSC